LDDESFAVVPVPSLVRLRLAPSCGADRIFVNARDDNKTAAETAKVLDSRRKGIIDVGGIATESSRRRIVADLS